MRNIYAKYIDKHLADYVEELYSHRSFIENNTDYFVTYVTKRSNVFRQYQLRLQATCKSGIETRRTATEILLQELEESGNCDIV